MPSKLSRYCLGVMEAAWLLVVSIIPIFFNIYSSRIFEPDKITILRSLALLTLAAWAIKLFDEGGIKWKKEAQDSSLIKYLWHYPLIAPVIGLVIVYLISTIFSVTPAISFFGSWQRLQGTYTTFSYLVIFISILVNLRKKEQINRLLTTIIIASLPVSLYGLLQKYQIDPIPWGGNVSVRITANMGNSIFVAAYLIMVFPLTISRLLEAFKAILSEAEPGGSGSKNIVRAVLYIFIAAFQLIAIYLSGSRGPLLGLFAGTYFMLLLYSLYWRKRWLTFTAVGLAIIGAAFLAVFNLSNGPLQALKTSPAIGRFGNLLNPESNSALVRQYIWEGTVRLVSVHDPLKFPDGSTDKFNFLRPLIGYGPETMYVAYNQFYQPELGQVEKRNASPDRSHNETWDSIVITGTIGLVVYLAIFCSVFYYGLKWQGLLTTLRNKIFFLAFVVAGGVLGSIVLVVLKGIEFFGVGLPLGLVVGVILYLTINALFLSPDHEIPREQNQYIPLMIALFSAVVAHFVEINFGIAIVATRTLFWIYAGLMLVVGFVLPKQEQSATAVELQTALYDGKPIEPMRKKDRQNSRRSRYASAEHTSVFFGDQPGWMRNGLVGAIIMGVILTTLGYDFITSSTQSTSIIRIITESLTRLPDKDNAVSFGIPMLILLTWITGILLSAVEHESVEENESWTKGLVRMGVLSLFVGFIFWLLQAINLAVLASYKVTNYDELLAQAGTIGSILSKYYLFIFLLLLLAAFFLTDKWPTKNTSSKLLAILFAPAALALVLAASNISNIKVIEADMTFKVAEPFTRKGYWEAATMLYQKSVQQTPQEDHYYLYLGRSYLEQGKITESTTDQAGLVSKAETDLKIAQSINPLDTDHTANLARLYSWWASQATTQSTLVTRAQQASDYFATALTLSPNNSTIWDEWAVLYLQLLNQPQPALERLNHALQLDSKYSYTQGLLGDYYLYSANSAMDNASKEQALLIGAKYYRAAADLVKTGDVVSKSSYLISLANAYSLLSNLDPQNISRVYTLQAIDALQKSIEAGLNTSDLWKVQQSIAKLYLQIGDKANAQFYAGQALQTAPSSAIGQIQDIITQTQSLP